ncbi:dimethylaniline monooxygenase [Aspergillus niger ATCC 13496]|uniref:Dimethylaniline monooxygenase n=1 Tax=Aspergillus niger ATCC 13496 TaxID=1353008 RepID=A0A370BWN6_ASPNG|nr:dimethylaniline monooxygenase [Aspergillus niger ATCC 13496]
MQPQEEHEVIIVGAGLAGLAAAKTYLELSPETDLLMLEARSAVGGVWAENSYECLHTNNLYGTYELSSFSLDPTKYDVQPEAPIPGYVLKQYFSDFIDHFDLRRRTRFNTRVHTVRKEDGFWEVHTGSVLYKCSKLIMSPGLCSTANEFPIPGQQNFGRPIMNHSQLGTKGALLANDPAVKSVTVIGASKYGYDAVYLMASHGKRVEWIIRKSGGGAVWMALPWLWFGPWRLKLEGLTTTRIITWFSPCIWGNCDGFGWVRGLLHGTALGSLFWTGRLGVLNYPTNIYDYVRSGQVSVNRKDISHLSEGEVNFTDGTVIKTDALIRITGWKLAPGINYEPEGLVSSLGIPTRDPFRDRKAWDRFDRAADEEILDRFPALRHQPAVKTLYKPRLSPFRLYRGIASPEMTAKGDQSIAFLGMLNGTSNALLIEVQALWTYAYLNNQVPIDRSKVYYQTALTSRYGRHRHPCGFASWYPETIFDAIPYSDMLLMDLGINRWRKRSWLREVFEDYTVHDYRGINQEWKQQHKILS